MLLDGQKSEMLLDSRDLLVGNLQISELKTVDLVFSHFFSYFYFIFHLFSYFGLRVRD